MVDNTIIKNKAEFETTAQTFLDKIFKLVLKNNPCLSGCCTHLAFLL